MKYYLVFVQIIFLWSGIYGQSIIGETYVCPGDIEYYQIDDDRCATFTSSEWDITNGTDTYFGLVEATEVQWSFEDDETGTVNVSYTCLPHVGSEPIVENLTLEVDIRQIQVPFFDDPFVVRPMEDNSSFTISTPNQGDDFLYYWSFPECFSGVDGTYFTTVTPDLYGIGTICLTVYDNKCGTNITECIDVTRSCEDSIIYTPSDILPLFTSADINISTEGNVVTTLDYTEFKAGVSIDLNPGFFTGAEFYAHIGECGRSPDSEDCIGMGTSGLVQSIDIDIEKETLFPGKDKSNWKGNTELLISDEIEMIIAPNPTSDNFTILMDDFDLGKDYQFEIMSLNGGVIRRGQLSGRRTQIDVATLSKGVYLVKVFTTKGSSYTRLMKF